MKQELIEEFRVSVDHVTVIPFGINNTFPNTTLSNAEARASLGLAADDLVLLFFGRIAPYKGLEYLVRAFELVSQRNLRYRLIIAGTPQDGEAYWKNIRQYIDRSSFGHKVIQRIQWISDDAAETYFKAADALVLPYTYIFQSGILFLGYSFGLPVISSDVGSLKDEILDGETGFVCKPRDVLDLASAIERYFDSSLYRDLERQRQKISEYANARYSWTKVGAITADVYSSLLRP
jgi:glycosyltransferase involved in cell wall biosynthesis